MGRFVKNLPVCYQYHYHIIHMHIVQVMATIRHKKTAEDPLPKRDRSFVVAGRPLNRLVAKN